jgi:hypothetical protein
VRLRLQPQHHDVLYHAGAICTDVFPKSPGMGTALQ